MELLGNTYISGGERNSNLAERKSARLAGWYEPIKNKRVLLVNYCQAHVPPESL